MERPARQHGFHRVGGHVVAVAAFGDRIDRMPAQRDDRAEIVGAAHLAANVVKGDMVDVLVPAEFDAAHVESPYGRIGAGDGEDVGVGFGGVTAEGVVLVAEHRESAGCGVQCVEQRASVRREPRIDRDRCDGSHMGFLSG